MIAFPFQSNFQGMDEHGNPKYDRAVNASFYRAMQKLFYKNGVFANPSNNFMVLAHSGMTVRVKAGACFIEGVTGIEIENTDLTLDNGEELQSRTDIIVLRADFSQNRRITVEIKKGTTELRRDSDVWELCLAKINVNALATQVNQSHITDTRLDGDLCGTVSGNVDSVDTTELFKQYEAYLNEQIADWDKRKKKQSDEHEEQSQEHSRQFGELKGTIESWYNSVKVDIAKLQTFDFDNLAELKGTTRNTVFEENGSITEKLVKSSDSKLVAKRETTFAENGDIIVNQTVYDSDGVQVLRSSTTTTKFKESGEIEEVVS